MKKDSVTLHTVDSRNKFLRDCLFNEFSSGYQEAIAIVERASSSEDVIRMVLTSETMKGTQIYAELSKDRPDHWKRVLEDIDGWFDTYSDKGSLLIGTDAFTVGVPNGYGDGEMHFAVVWKGCFNHDMLDFWSYIEGNEINVYKYDCSKDEIVTVLDGRYGVFYGFGFVVFERWGDSK